MSALDELPKWGGCVVPDDQLYGYVVVVIRPTGNHDEPAADAYGPHGEMVAHDIATCAVRSQRAAYLVDLGDLTVERYDGNDS